MQITNNKSLEDYSITSAETSVIFKDNMNQPIHRWFLYTQGFSNEFVNFYFDKYKIDSSKSVYDPFMGSGTVGLCSKFKDRKSTRLNSSHVAISYAVFCLKKEIAVADCFVHKVLTNYES